MAYGLPSLARTSQLDAVDRTGCRHRCRRSSGIGMDQKQTNRASAAPLGNDLRNDNGCAVVSRANAVLHRQSDYAYGVSEYGRRDERS